MIKNYTVTKNIDKQDKSATRTDIDSILMQENDQKFTIKIPR
jgi:hypothetical protein